MPLVPFDALPEEARIWIFASDTPIVGAPADHLLAQVDDFLEEWKAHGQPLRAAREWRDDRFLVVGIDPTAEQASGCSIDGLFRRLMALQTSIGARLLGGGRVFYRDEDGATRMVPREEFEAMCDRGEIADTTPVFDMSITSLDAWRARFERPYAESWARR